MRIIFGLVFVVGLGLAGFAVYMAQDFIKQTQVDRDRLLAEQAAAPRLVDVVVATKAMKYGERFTRNDLEVIKWQADKVPAGAFPIVVAAQGGDPAIVPVFFEGETRPRAMLRSIEPFEPLLASKITEPGIDAGITANLSPGMRALALNVDVSSGVSGFLRPGDRVDVIWTGDANNRQITKLIQSAVRIIAIDQSADADRTEETQIARTITIEGSIDQVNALTLAQNSGRLTLALVGASDDSSAAAVGSEIDRKTLLGIEDAPAPVVVEEEKVCTIRTNKGGEIVETQIPCTN
ncbi:Flp pilus assembly protein CpaB [Frigidibacter sp. SD6-1]|uniref:Flp pilus assembly protein CpaB n=1 Tax=Frigidibacter sp. SD6-1 TaxID=3032581 RepID=UPI0024DF5AD8|nr:Flp pilus assembly protein CpaB [Frigidibacter sp. SD6-1]